MTQNILVKEAVQPTENIIHNAFSLVESIKSYIYDNECPALTMDISHLNVIDASKVALLCSTYHYAKYPHGEMSWRVNSTEVHNLIKPLNLGNIRLITV